MRTEGLVVLTGVETNLESERALQSMVLLRESRETLSSKIPRLLRESREILSSKIVGLHRESREILFSIIVRLLRESREHRCHHVAFEGSVYN